MPKGEEQLQTALAKTAEDHGPGLYGLVTEDGRISFAGTVGLGQSLWKCCYGYNPAYPTTPRH